MRWDPGLLSLYGEAPCQPLVPQCPRTARLQLRPPLQPGYSRTGHLCPSLSAGRLPASFPPHLTDLQHSPHSNAHIQALTQTPFPLHMLSYPRPRRVQQLLLAVFSANLAFSLFVTSHVILRSSSSSPPLLTSRAIVLQHLDSASCRALRRLFSGYLILYPLVPSRNFPPGLKPNSHAPRDPAPSAVARLIPDPIALPASSLHGPPSPASDPCACHPPPSPYCSVDSANPPSYTPPGTAPACRSVLPPLPPTSLPLASSLCHPSASKRLSLSPDELITVVSPSHATLSYAPYPSSLTALDFHRCPLCQLDPRPPGGLPASSLLPPDYLILSLHPPRSSLTTGPLLTLVCSTTPSSTTDSSASRAPSCLSLSLSSRLAPVLVSSSLPTTILTDSPSWRSYPQISPRTAQIADQDNTQRTLVSLILTSCAPCRSYCPTPQDSDRSAPPFHGEASAASRHYSSTWCSFRFSSLHPPRHRGYPVVPAPHRLLVHHSASLIARVLASLLSCTSPRWSSIRLIPHHLPSFSGSLRTTSPTPPLSLLSYFSTDLGAAPSAVVVPPREGQPLPPKTQSTPGLLVQHFFSIVMDLPLPSAHATNPPPRSVAQPISFPKAWSSPLLSELLLPFATHPISLPSTLSVVYPLHFCSLCPASGLSGPPHQWLSVAVFYRPILFLACPNFLRACDLTLTSFLSFLSFLQTLDPAHSSPTPPSSYRCRLSPP
ncbi:unnamed protein product [Dicrocoelium dendriticum]|nr:unnamed protein product [Dicrocoelium dendriticum]